MKTPHLFRCLAFALAASALYAANAPVPLVDNPLVPDATAPGSAGFTLTVNGAGFEANAVVNWNGSPRATAFAGESQLTATISASDVAAAETASVTVTNPAPGGGTSNVAFFQVASPAAVVGMAAASTYPLASAAVVAAGDLNGDGKLDLAVGFGAASVAVMLGNGDGTFQSPAPFAVSGSPYSIAIGDFNNDGKLDIAIGDGHVDILLGNGDGTFQPYQSYTPKREVYWIALGDFNGDGKLDVAAIGGEAFILLGKGDGTFKAGPGYLLHGDALGVATGDFNRDGSLDMAVAESNRMQILLGNGDGSFRRFAEKPGAFYSVTAADFNGDGILDLAATGDQTSGQIYILLGTGTGGFTAAGGRSFPGNLDSGLVAGDFNGDGIPDLAAVVRLGSVGAVAILLGKGDGTFQPAAILAGQPDSGPSLAMGDFNGDGLLDLASLEYPNSGAVVSVDLQTDAALSPGLLSFAPAVEKTTSPSKTVTFTNLGSATLGITQVAVSGTNAGEFALSNDTCMGSSVSPAGNCTVDVTFSPVGAGQQTAFLSISGDAAVSPQVTALSGDGTALDLTPRKLDFGSVKVGKLGPKKVIIVANVSSQTVSFNINLTGRDPGDFIKATSCGSELTAKASCTIEIQFTPTRTGSRTASLQITQGTTGADPGAVPLSGTGT